MSSKCLIIDDEPLARSIVAEYLQTHPDIEVAQECGDGFEGVKAIMQHHPDLIFLDVQMPKINGFEMLELVEHAPSVIFTTAFDEYAIKAFEANAVDYLLKPFSKARFDAALQKWQEQRKAAAPEAKLQQLEETTAKQPEEQVRIVVKVGNNIKIIPVTDVLYLEAYDDYVKIHTREGTFLKKKTMGGGCNICKGSGWVEIGGAGMVDPAVLESCKIDPKVYSGFAFGMGIERITMLKYQIKDLRLFTENDVRFLRQFEGVI